MASITQYRGHKYGRVRPADIKEPLTDYDPTVRVYKFVDGEKVLTGILDPIPEPTNKQKQRIPIGKGPHCYNPKFREI